MVIFDSAKLFYIHGNTTFSNSTEHWHAGELVVNCQWWCSSFEKRYPTVFGACDPCGLHIQARWRHWSKDHSPTFEDSSVAFFCNRRQITNWQMSTEMWSQQQGSKIVEFKLSWHRRQGSCLLQLWDNRYLWKPDNCQFTSWKEKQQ